MIPMGGKDPQDLINEELLNQSDILIAIFKGQLGSTRGTEREVRYFIELGHARRLMLFFHRDESLREPDLRDFIDEIKKSIFYKRYEAESELAIRVRDALLEKAMNSLAAPHVASLYEALVLRLRQWGSLNHEASLLEEAYEILRLAAEALIHFTRREAGLGIGTVDGPVTQMSQRLERLTRDKDAFIDRAPWHEADETMKGLMALVSALPAEHELI